MSYAVIKAGGRHVRVEPGELLRVDRLGREPGDSVTFDDVRMVGDGETISVGTPRVAGASVKATVVEERRDRKVIVFKKKRRKQYRRTRGHREWFTLVRVDGIEAGA